jgi:hypothetical protein
VLAQVPLDLLGHSFEDDGQQGQGSRIEGVGAGLITPTTKPVELSFVAKHI